jgi:hypothetical protein
MRSISGLLHGDVGPAVVLSIELARRAGQPALRTDPVFIHP